MMNRPLVGIGVIILKNNQILLGKRKNSHGAGLWSFPGGHLEFNEGLEDCAIREVFEETGLSISMPTPVTFFNNLFPKEKKHYVTLYMQAKWISGTPELKEPDKCEGWYWFDLYSLPKPLWSGVERLLTGGWIDKKGLSNV